MQKKAGKRLIPDAKLRRNLMGLCPQVSRFALICLMQGYHGSENTWKFIEIFQRKLEMNFLV